MEPIESIVLKMMDGCQACVTNEGRLVWSEPDIPVVLTRDEMEALGELLTRREGGVR